MVAISHPNSIRTPLPPARPRRRGAVHLPAPPAVAAALAPGGRGAGAGERHAPQRPGRRPQRRPPTRPGGGAGVVVEPGDTVWSIAESLARDGDVRPVVDALVDANGGADLEVGDRLVIALP